MHYFVLSINWSRFLCYEISALCLWLCTVIEDAPLPSISLLKTNFHLFRRHYNTVKATLCAKRLQSMSCIINKTVSDKIMFLSSQYTCTCKLLFFFFRWKKITLKRVPWLILLTWWYWGLIMVQETKVKWCQVTMWMTCWLFWYFNLDVFLTYHKIARLELTECLT